MHCSYKQIDQKIFADLSPHFYSNAKLSLQWSEHMIAYEISKWFGLHFQFWEGHIHKKVVSKSDSEMFASQTCLLVWEVGLLTPHLHMIVGWLHAISIFNGPFPQPGMQQRASILQVCVKLCGMSIKFSGQMKVCEQQLVPQASQHLYCQPQN